jgi:hypothetical protein
LKQAAFFVAFLIFLSALVVGLERGFSPFFQNCIKQHQNSASLAAAYVQCTGIFINTNGNGITALATVVIAAFTATLWVTSSRQAELTKEALIANRRAFITPVNFLQIWELDSASGLYNWRLRPQWRNTGETPTKDMVLHVQCEIRNAQLPQGYNFTYQEADIAHGIIGPKVDMHGGLAPRGAAITPQDILDAQNVRKFIYLWGWVKYFDVFPDTPRHTTHFCWLIYAIGDPGTFVPNTPGQPPTPGTLSFTYLQHTEGNYSD